MEEKDKVKKKKKSEEIIEDKKEEIVEENKQKEEIKESKNPSKNKNGILNLFLILLLILSLVNLICQLIFKTSSNQIISITSSIILMIFTIYYVIIAGKINHKNKKYVIFGSIFLILYFIFNLFTNTFKDSLALPNNKVINFTNMSLTEVIDWADANNIKLEQIYEYSDMIDEYHIICQDILPGEELENVKTIKISISEGASPDKEIMVPKMINWDKDRVLKFVKENHLSNVNVSFEESDKLENTVIDQDKSGNLKRNEEINLVFSSGEEITYKDIKLIDLTNKSLFEVKLYLESNHIKYDIDYKFDNKIRQGLVCKQSIGAGTTINGKVNNITIYISKGPEIKVIDLTNMSMSEVSDWIIKNKLKLEINDKYDDKIEENHVISFDKKVGDVVEAGTLIKVTLSKGKLVMPSFDNLNEFRDWAMKYSINYEERYEFNDKVSQGDVISYSYKKGDVIKNDSSIIVTISNGKKISVPNVVGMSKNSAYNKLKNSGLNCSYAYSYSDSVLSGNVIRQSIQAGSGVGSGTTITITISKGSRPTPPEPPKCVPKTYTVDRSIYNVFSETGSFENVKNKLYSFFNSKYPGVKINVVGVSETGKTPGSYISGIGPGSSITSCNNTPYTISIAN